MPGLAPGANRPNEVDISPIMEKAAQLDPAGSTASEVQDANPPTKSPASENTEVREPVQREVVEPAQEREMSQREANRVQALANAKAEAEKRAQEAEFAARQAQETLQRVVGQQPQVNVEDQLARQFPSYQTSVGYPTDPREYAQFVEMRSQARAEAAATQAARREREQTDIARMFEENPDIQGDQIIMGAIAAKRATGLSYTESARQVKRELEERTKKVISSRVADEDHAKNEAYVETTRGASTNRRADEAPSVDKMSLSEMEDYLKKTNNW